jgi:hypothetical protein
MTISDLAKKLAKSLTWVSERLGLVKLTDEIAKLVDANTINLSNAYALAKLPEEEQANFVDRAITMTPQEFVPQVNNRVKEIREAKRQGRDATKAEFTPMPHLQKLTDIKTEFAEGKVAETLVADLGITDPVEAFKLGVAWTLHMDPVSQQIARQEHASVSRPRPTRRRSGRKRLARSGPTLPRLPRPRSRTPSGSSDPRPALTERDSVGTRTARNSGHSLCREKATCYGPSVRYSFQRSNVSRIKAQWQPT